MKLSLGFSPCPNDTFIFDAIVNQKLASNIDWEIHIADVAELNQMAFNNQLDVTKLSYHAFGHLTKDYQLLNAGSALGNNCGPLLIAKKPYTEAEIPHLKIAIPGVYTTANFLLSIAYPEAKDKTSMLFSEIELAVLSGEYDAGLIIHENRFTYQDKGLVKLKDLGAYWEQTYLHPIPLGGIAIKRTLADATKKEVDELIAKSVAKAFEDAEGTIPYVRQYAQEMDTSVMMKHIALYVNDYSLDLGEKGRQAIKKLYDLAENKELIPSIVSPVFV